MRHIQPKPLWHLDFTMVFIAVLLSVSSLVPESFAQETRRGHSSEQLASTQGASRPSTGGCALADRFARSEMSSRISRHITRMGGHTRTSGGRCYFAVQRALHRAGAIPYPVIGSASRDAETHLSPFGFTNLMTDPACRDHFRTPNDAPEGSVLVYRGGNCPPARRILCGGQDCGHVEIRVGSRFISDYASDLPVTGSLDATLGGGQNCRAGRGFELIGILVPNE